MMKNNIKRVLGIVKITVNYLILLFFIGSNAFAENDNSSSGAGVWFMLILMVVLLAIFNGSRGKDKEDNSYDNYDGYDQYDD